MADKDSRVDLIHRAAQKLQRRDDRSLAERAAEKLAQMNQVTTAAPPSPPQNEDAAPVQPARPRTVPVEPKPEGAASRFPPQAASAAEREILSATGRRDAARPAGGLNVDAPPAEQPASHVVALAEDDDSPSAGVLTAAGRRKALPVEDAVSRKPAPTARRTATQRQSEQPKAVASGKAESSSQRVNIDMMRLHLAGYVTPQSERTRISEEYRVIKRPLLLNAFARGEHRIPNGHLIMVTSARPGEGKTFTSLNLAMSMASERELYVLLIDADVHRGSLMAELGVTAEKGLVDMLADDSLTLSDTLVRTNIPNLTLLPSGMRHPEATELLASQRMTRLMEDIANRYPDRVIIIDTPPILASSEAGVLGLQVGQVVMVVEWGATTRQAIEQALPLIGTCQHINFVLNKASFYMGSDRFGMYTSDGVYGD